MVIFNNFLKSNIIILILAILIILGLIHYFNFSEPRTFPNYYYLEKMGVEFRESEKFILESKAEEKVGGLQKTNFIAKNGETILRLEQIKPLSQNKAEKRKLDYFQNLEALFLPSSSPYSEFITNQIECPKEFWPSVEDFVWQLYASNNLTYGVCAWDLIKFNSVLKFEYCSKEKALYEIEIFIPHNKDFTSSLLFSAKEIIKSFKCK